MNRPKTDAEIEDLIAELREYTYTGYYSWDFDLNHAAALARVREFLEPHSEED
jgi:hypothetical protein